MIEPRSGPFTPTLLLPSCGDTSTLTGRIQDVHILAGLWQKECGTAVWSPTHWTTTEHRGGGRFTLRLPLLLKVQDNSKWRVGILKGKKKRANHLEPWACDALGGGGGAMCFLACVVVSDAWRRNGIKTSKYQCLQNCLCFQIKQRKYCYDTRLAVFIACAAPY